MASDRLRITRSPGLPPPAEWAHGEVAPRFRHLIEPRETPLMPEATDPTLDDEQEVRDGGG